MGTELFLFELICLSQKKVRYPFYAPQLDPNQLALEQNIMSHVSFSKSALKQKYCSGANFMSNVIHPEQNQCSWANYIAEDFNFHKR